jgi:diguanylate cyclase (GGDEF)-like protein/PAS domain S-box-containing protein
MREKSMPFFAWPNYINICLAIFIFFLTLGIAYYVWRHRAITSAKHLAGLALSVTFWSLAYFLESISFHLDLKIFWENIQYIILAFIPLQYLYFILVYTNGFKPYHRYLFPAFFIEPLLNLVLLGTNLSPSAFRVNAFIQTNHLPFPGYLVSQYGHWFWFSMIYLNLFLLGDFIALLLAYLRAPHWTRDRYWYLLLALLFPWIFSLIDLPDWLSPNQDYLLLAAITVSVLIMGWSLLRTRILDIMPIARDAVLDQINDAIFILDSEKCLVEMNQAARKIHQVRPDLLIGKPINHLFPQLASLELNTTEPSSEGFEISLTNGSVPIYFDAKISPLISPENKTSGWLLIFHDVTHRKHEADKLRAAESLAELSLRDAKKQSVALNTIHSSTENLNQAGTLRSALIPTLTTIFDITHSPRIWLYLRDEIRPNHHREVFFDPADKDRPLQFSDSLPNRSACLKELLDGTLQQPQEYPLLPEQESQPKTPSSTMIVFPLRARNSLIGVLNLAQTQSSPISEETIHLIETLCTSLSATIDRVHLLRTEYDHRRLAEAFRSISSMISSSLNVNEMLNILLSQLSRLIPLDAGTVFAVEGDTARIIRSKGYETFGITWPHDIEELKFSIPDTPNLQKIIETRKAVTIPDTHLDPDWKINRISQHFHSWIGAPVIIDDQIAYIFSLDKIDANFYTRAHLENFNLFCSEVSLSIQKARLFESDRKRIRELEILQATLTAITSQLEINHLLNEILNRALELLVSSSGTLALYEPESHAFRMAVNSPVDLPIKNVLVSADEGIMGEIYRTRLPLVLDDYSSWPQRVEQFVPSFPHAVLAVPLNAGSELFGALVIGSEDSESFYNQDDTRLLSLFAQQATIAINNARLFASAQARAHEAETLQKASAIIASSLEQRPTLHQILKQLARVISYDSASILLLHGEELELVQGDGFEDQSDLIGLRISLSQNQPGAKVCRQKKTLIVNHLPIEYPAFNDINQHSILSWLGVPLIYKGRIIGILSLDSLEDNYFTEKHAKLASAFADQVAVVLENTRLYESAIDSARQFSALYNLSQKISLDLPPQEVYQAIHNAAKVLMACDCFYLSLYNKEERLIQDAYMIDNGVLQKNGSRPLGQGLFSLAITQNRSLIYNDFTSETQKATQAITIGAEADPTQVRSLIVVPIRLGKEIKGVISAQSYHANAYREEDRESLEMLATQTAIALQNNSLFSKVQEMAMTDSLTNICNRRRFFELADAEFARSHRYQHPLSMIMMDIDHFKRVNDNHGHAVGDIVLKQVAAMCKSSLRTVDLFARYGGEEFVVMLPETTVEEASYTAERMRSVVACTPILVEKNLIQITLSFGVVELDESCKNIEELLDRSDQALYESKHNGRNRVSIWKPQSKK